MYLGGKEMRKFIALLLAMMMVFAFTACGGSSEEAETEPAEAPVVHSVSGIVEDLAATSAEKSAK